MLELILLSLMDQRNFHPYPYIGCRAHSCTYLRMQQSIFLRLEILGNASILKDIVQFGQTIKL